MKKKVKIIGLLVICLVLLLSCSKKNENKVAQIGYIPITHALPLYVESDIKKADIELVKFGSWPELMEALNSGKIDGASVLLELAMKAKVQGSDLKAVALGHSEGNAVIVSNSINSIKDLKNKKFAVPNKLSTHNILLYQILKSEGMTLDDIEVVELAPSEMVVALQEGRIDGYCVAEPFGAKAVESGTGKVLKQSGDIMEDSVCCSLVLRSDFIRDNREEAEEIVKLYKESCEYIEENENVAAEETLKFLKIDKDTLNLSLKWISFNKFKIEEAEYIKIANLVEEMKLLDQAPLYEDFIDNSFIDEVK